MAGELGRGLFGSLRRRVAYEIELHRADNRAMRCTRYSLVERGVRSVLAGNSFFWFIGIYVAVALEVVLIGSALSVYAPKLLPASTAPDIGGFLKDATSYLITAQVGLVAVVSVAVGLVRPCCTDQLGWGLGPGSVEDVLLCESGTCRSLVRVAPPQSLRERQSGLSSPRWEGATPSITPGMSAVPFKANADRRHHIPKQQDRVTNWSEYDAALRQRGSLTVWFSEEAIAAWRAEPRTTRGGQPLYSALAIATALTLRAVFRLALRQTEGLIGSVIHPLGLDLAIPDHSTLSRRAETLAVARPPCRAGPVHLLVDSTGLKLCGAGEWLVEKHGTSRRRSWRKLHIGVDADTGRIVAAALTTNDLDDGSQVGPLLDQIDDAIASFTGDGAYDQDAVYGEVAARHADAAVIVPPRSNAVPSQTAETAPTPRDRHLNVIAEHGRMGWQKASGYNWRALVEADIGRWKRVIGHALRSQTDKRQATEVAIAVDILNRMLELGRPSYVRIA